VEALDGRLLNLLQKNAPLADFFETEEVRVCGKNVLMMLVGLLQRLGLALTVLRYTMSRQVKDSKDSSVSYCSACV
jgi:AmmeMemoRadiSam system protein B